MTDAEAAATAAAAAQSLAAHVAGEDIKAYKIHVSCGASIPAASGAIPVHLHHQNFHF